MSVTPAPVSRPPTSVPRLGLPPNGTIAYKTYNGAETCQNEYVYLQAPPDKIRNAKAGTEFWAIPLVKMVKQPDTDILVRKNLQFENDGHPTKPNCYNTFHILKP